VAFVSVRARPLATPTEQTRRGGFQKGAALGRGVAAAYLTLVVLLPLAAVAVRGTEGGLDGLWASATTPAALAAIRLSFFGSLTVVVINAVAGTLLAWVLVRDSFPGKAMVDAIVDLPFALPTIVAGLTLLALYGPKGPLGVNIAYTRAGVLLALLFVTLPFVVRSAQPVLAELESELEEAAASLGAGGGAIFRLVVLPNLIPAILSGVGLAFARAIGEFGAVVLISGNVPFDTEVAAVHVFGQVESDNTGGAAAISLVLLATSLLTLLVIDRLAAWGNRHRGD